MDTHQGGYTPFAFELDAAPGTSHQLVIRVDDVERPFHAGKDAGLRGRPRHLADALPEARGKAPLDVLHFTPDLEAKEVASLRIRQQYHRLSRKYHS